MFMLKAPRVVCTYDIYSGLNRPLAHLEDMLKDPRSKIRLLATGMKLGVAYANPLLMVFLEELLAEPPTSDHEGAKRVLKASKLGVIGDAMKADHADYPMILQYCQVHREVLPLTCLMLLSYGHTKEWTHPAVSQAIYPLYESLVDKLEITPAVARAVVEFTAADYDLNDWLPDQTSRALPRFLFANDCLRRAEALKSDPLDDARAKLAKQVAHFTSRTGTLSRRHMELTSAAVNKIAAPDGALLNLEELKVVHSMRDLISDHAEGLWPFEKALAPIDLLARFDEFFELNRKGAEANPHQAYDECQACTWMLKSIAGAGNNLSNHFSSKAILNEGGTAKKLSEFITRVRRHPIDPDLISRAMLSLTAALATWIGVKNLHATQIAPGAQNEILREVFQDDHLPDLETLLADHGKRVMTSFVMSERRALSAKLSRLDRGRFLEDEIGL